jgi:hypothetical protein
MRLHKVTGRLMGTSDDRRAVKHLCAISDSQPRGWWRSSPGARWWVDNQNAYLRSTLGAGDKIPSLSRLCVHRREVEPVSSNVSVIESGAGAVHAPLSGKGGDYGHE